MEKQKLKEKTNIGALSVRNTRKNLPNCAPKENKGITLVALIITIIVLLILAVVAIRAVQEDGIITKAKEAKSATTVAQEKEQIGLAVNGWKIQKNYPTNGDTFYSFMNEKLKDVAEEMEDNGDGSITVRMQNTGNIYTIQEDGTITGPDVIKTENLSSLEKYFLGLDGKGRSLDVIMPNEETFVSINEVPDIIGEDIEFLAPAFKNSNTTIGYISYEGEKYKFALNVETYQIKGLYGVKRIDNWSAESRVGKYVKDENNNIWRIIYDDETHGLQMISANTYKYNDSNFYLGNNDTLITDWTKLNKETKEFELADLNGNKLLDNDLEKSIYSYNQAVETLNTACENLFKENGNYTKTYIQDVRSVGSNPIFANKDNENNTPYTSQYLKIWPHYTAGLCDGKGYSTDNNFETDFERMIALGINKSDTDYWLASRVVNVDPQHVVDFCICCVNEKDDDVEGFVDASFLWYVSPSSTVGWCSDNALRPVVSLSSNIQFSGEGTEVNPYTF